jgi:lipoyl(octanoyl) transferase
VSAPVANPFDEVLVRRLPRLADYEPVWRGMRAFTDSRDADTPDEIWLVEHAPVFTLGQAGKPEHVLNPGDIPVVPIDRGGQVTYHGPGQLVAYVLVDLRRRKLGVRQLVTALEESVVALLAGHGVDSAARPDAPGVYVGEKKIAALGLRVRNGRSYHGLALNVDMDLEPYLRINPCGYPGMQVEQTSALGVPGDWDELGSQLVARLCEQLGYNRALEADPPELPPKAG